MIGKVAVDGNAVLGLAEMHPIGFDDDGPVALLEKKDIGGDFRSGIGLESVAGEPDGSQQAPRAGKYTAAPPATAYPSCSGW